MRLSPTAFNRHLAHVGQQVLWRASNQCPCINPTSGQPDPRCQHCSGKGHIWKTGVPSVAGAAGQKTQAQWAQAGQWANGDIVFTLPGNQPIWDMGQFDRVVMLNASDKFSQPMTRGGPTERLLFTPERLDRVFWIDKVTKAIVEGGVPTASSTGVLSWASGEPPPGQVYSLTGRRFSEYFCFQDLVSNRNEHSGAHLPRKVVLRRFDLLGR